MSSYPKGLALAALAVFLLGLALYFGGKTPAEAPPVLTERSQKAKPQIQDPDLSVEALSGPWFRSPPVVSAPPPRAVKAPVHIDNTSVTFLGSSIDKNGTPTFFFKNLQSGQVILLALGETKKGWTLKTVGDRTFTLLGSGGVYEVSR